MIDRNLDANHNGCHSEEHSGDVAYQSVTLFSG
jgi:hypothetical protein